MMAYSQCWSTAYYCTISFFLLLASLNLSHGGALRYCTFLSSLFPATAKPFVNSAVVVEPFSW